MSLIILMGISLVVGFLCGCTSIGGILLIPALAACSGLPVHVAMSTALFSFFFSAALGTWLHHRNRALDWNLATPLCVGAILSGAVGAIAKQYIDAAWLTGILAILILIAGMNTLFPFQRLTCNLTEASGKTRQIALFLLGISVSFVAGMTGAGGPVLTVPIMIMAGFSPLASVAVAQPFQVVAAFSGSVGNVALGAINYHIALWTTLAQLVGIVLGVALAGRLNTESIKKAVAFMCLGTGIYLLICAA